MNGKNIAAALLRASIAYPTIAKSSVAKIDTRGGGSYSYHYADLGALLDAVRPALAAEGVLLAFQTSPGGGVGPGATLAIVLTHAESGEEFRSELPLAVDDDPKALGSRLTYLMRYLTRLATAVHAEDDDEEQRHPDRSVTVTSHGGGGGGGGSGRENRTGLDWIADTLAREFGGEKPWEPKVKNVVLKDALGSGSWKDGIMPMTLDDLRTAAVVDESCGMSRLVKVCRLVKSDIRRPDDVDWRDWPTASAWAKFAEVE